MTNAKPIIKNDDYREYAPAPRLPGLDPERLKGTNVNPATLLATDFLNPFNEIEMVIEMLPGIPEYYEEIVGWKPRSYCEHFARSALPHAALALEAYDYLPEGLRELFENVVDRLNETTTRVIHSAGIALETQDPDIIVYSCAGASAELRALIKEAGSLINGTALRKSQANGASPTAVDSFFDN